ncbi:MAG: hypothetical protein ACKOC5_10020 [Chloroflexota bacterium]
MKWLESRMLWGGLLIVGGVLFLLQNLGFLPLGDVFWGIVIGLGGVFFLSWFTQGRHNWWALIPGFALLSVAASILLDLFAPALAELFSGSLVLGGIGLSFWLIYLFDRSRWWALIPGGVLLTLASMVVLENRMGDAMTVGVFFAGMGLTFALVAVLPNPVGEMRWAWIPAGILLVIGFMFIATAGDLLIYVMPLALILIGLAMMFRTLRRK